MNAKVYCDGTRIRCLHEIKLTVSMSGAPVEFDFSSEWDGLGKTAVFTCDGTKDVILDAEGKAVVPHEILTTPGMDVVVGVYAVREDGTTWPAPTPLCRIGRVETGADPSGDESYPPTPDVGEQAVAAASKALEAAAEAQEVAADIQRRADAGEFDGKDGATGAKGDKGDPGIQGEKGDKGDTGAKGEKGDQGERGYTGATGARGEKGEKGDTGATGSPGEDGEDGGYYTPSLTRPNDSTLRFRFVPSKSGMAPVSAVDVTLPSGGSGGITEETDPTVPAWAKEATKPSYTAAEVGALPADTKIPTVPTTLPNPNKLTFSGAVNAEYDGSEAVDVVIPQGGGGGGASGGGDVWELIAFANVAEEVGHLTIDADTSGNAFTLKKFFIVFLGAPVPTDGTSSSLYRCYAYDAQGTRIQSRDIPLDKTRQTSALHYSDALRSVWSSHCDRNLSAEEYATLNFRQTIGFGYIGDSTTTGVNPNATVAKFQFGDWVSVKAGTDIYIYGVRA